MHPFCRKKGHLKLVVGIHVSWVNGDRYSVKALCSPASKHNPIIVIQTRLPTLPASDRSKKILRTKDNHIQLVLVTKGATQHHALDNAQQGHHQAMYWAVRLGWNQLCRMSLRPRWRNEQGGDWLQALTALPPVSPGQLAAWAEEISCCPCTRPAAGRWS